MENSLQIASRDASIFSLTPQAAVAPRTAAEIGELVRMAGSRSSRMSLTVRSGGTDMSGGPLTSSVVINMQKHFTKIGSIKNSTIPVQPGAWYRDLEEKLIVHHLMLPCYPASKNICTLGGMVANNAGGEKTLSYGKTAEYVKKLRLVLSDGQEYSCQPLTRRELSAKLSQRNFEGRLYQRLFKLLEKNYEVIQAAKPNVSKNSAGYALWDIWNKDTQIFDLTRLFSSSQGTLGIITEITFKLVTPKPHSQLLVIFLPDLTQLADVIKTVLTYAPESFEAYDDHTLRLARTITSRLLHIRGLPKLTLLAEFTGHDAKEVLQRVQAVRAALKRFAARTRLAKSPAETANYWSIRRESFNLLRHGARDHYATVPFIDDVIVRPEFLPEFLPRLQEIMERYMLHYTIAGHVGDGNFHIIPLMNTSDPEFLHTIEAVADQVCDLVLEFKGSLTAEHNDGLIRSHYLKKMFGEEVYSLFVETKKIFDPKNIFNPGKKVHADWEFAKQHIARFSSDTLEVSEGPMH